MPRETGIEDEIDNISLVSVSENPPSGPIKIAHFLKILDFVDDLLIFLFPSVFALNRRIVLKKVI